MDAVLTVRRLIPLHIAISSYLSMRSVRDSCGSVVVGVSVAPLRHNQTRKWFASAVPNSACGFA